MTESAYSTAGHTAMQEEKAYNLICCCCCVRTRRSVLPLHSVHQNHIIKHFRTSSSAMPSRSSTKAAILSCGLLLFLSTVAAVAVAASAACTGLSTDQSTTRAAAGRTMQQLPTECPAEGRLHTAAMPLQSLCAGTIRVVWWQWARLGSLFWQTAVKHLLTAGVTRMVCGWLAACG